MIKYKQHIPDFCSGFEPYKIAASSTEELLNDPRIKRQSNEKGFYRFSQNKNYNLKQSLLLVESDEGYNWRVLGYYTDKDGNPMDLGLPEFEPKYKKIEEIGNDC